MNKVQRIHLGRTPFTIAADAYASLQHYLEAVKAAAGAEVLKEVELRIAELLIERGVTGDKVVLTEDITALKKQLGDPSEFRDEPESGKHAASHHGETVLPKRLFRDPQQALVGGVAAGLSAYLGVDVTVIRLLFVVMTFAGGFGILSYIILWLVTPEARTPGDRLQMSGKPVTVEGIKEFVHERAHNPQMQAEVKRAVSLSGKLAQFAIRFLRLMFGGVCITIGFLGALYSTAAAIYVWLHPVTLAGFGALFPTESKETILLALAVVVSVMLFGMLFCVGLTSIRRKWPLPGWLTASVLGLFFIVSAVGVPLGLDVGQQVQKRYHSAQLTQSRSIAPFSKLSLKGSRQEYIRTYYQVAPTPEFTVSATGLTADSTHSIKVEVKGDTLYIDTTDFRAPECSFTCIDMHDVSLTVKGPKLEAVDVQDGGSFYSTAALPDTDVTLSVARNAELSMGGFVGDSLTAAFSGNDGMIGRFMLHSAKGAAGNAALQTNGDGSFRANGFEALSYQGERVCDEAAPLIFARPMPATITINSQTFTDAEIFQSTHTYEHADAHNCVVVH